MAADRHHILLLAGTFEARQLAMQLAETFPEVRLTISFAGAVKDLPKLGVPTRVGGFGGVGGLTSYAKSEDVSLILDVTHPFAAQMSANAATVARTLGLQLFRLERPQWQKKPGEDWIHVGSIAEAVSAIPVNARVFFGIGRKEIASFFDRKDIYGLVRMIEPPNQQLPDGWDLILSRPSTSPKEELNLFRRYRITYMIAKNSGGKHAVAKIDAARQLTLPVIMVERPQLPKATSTASTTQMVEWVKRAIVNVPPKPGRPVF